MKYIAICGTVGAGKTTLLQRLTAYFGPRAAFHEERPQDNPYINEYYSDSKRWSFHSQVSFLSLYFDDEKWRPEVGDTEFFFFDRAFLENLVIAKYRLNQQDLTQDEFGILCKLAHGIASLMPPVDKYLYLDCSVSTIIEHMRQRGREYEDDLDLMYVYELKELYDEWAKTLPPERKNLAYVYQLLTHNSEKTLTIMFEKLPPDHPARAPFNLFSQSSDTVKSGIILGLGTRLQVLQNEAVKQLVSFSDIDLTAPGSHKCVYYIILSDQETSMAFLSSLFFSFLFIKLTRFADLSPGGRCPVPVNLILDEFNNIGRIGGAPDGSDFCRSLSVIRSRDIRVMLAVQSLGQLQNRYPNNLWSEIIGNCDIQLMLGCTDDVTADYISDRSGEMCIVVDSTMTVKKTVAVTQDSPVPGNTGSGEAQASHPG